MGAANITNVAVSCGTQTTQIVIRSALLNGAQENPPVTTAATGVGGVIVNPTTKEITGGITFTGLTGVPTGAHIHRANGDIAIALVLAADNATATIPAGTTVATGPVLIDADYAELLAGTLYFNVHTAMNSGGEIRGQINLQGGVLAGLAALDGTQAQTASTAVGRGAVVVDSATRQILTGYATHNVISPSAAHIHTSAPTRDGNIEVGLTLGTNVVTASQGAMFTATDVQDLNANYLYFNIHSANCMTCGGGEIRGQILAQ